MQTQTQQQSKVSPAERAALFSQMTRQMWKDDGAIASVPGGTTKFNLNKVRLTNRVRVEVAFTLTVTHAANTSYVADDFAPFNVIRRIAVDMNNGFQPFVVSGKELYMYSLLQNHRRALTSLSSGRGKVVQPLVASSAGTANQVRFLADLPMALNDRDPVSLIVTQNQQTTVQVAIDFESDGTKLLKTPGGYTVAISNIVVTPLQETFTVPPIEQARPDIGILKLVQSTNEPISGSGVKTVKLPTGMTYRKIAFLITDSSGAGVTDASIAGDFEMVMNQSDIPYSIRPSILAAINDEEFGGALPQGVWAFDFSYQGISNYGGLRDYVDTEQLTEFWLRFNAPGAGNVSVVYEQLARLNQQY